MSKMEKDDKINKNRAIPSNYMTVGQVAKKMGVTVRALQYYDKEGVLCPSAQSEGGRRLYTDKDVVRLHQLLSLKQLGFSLEDIKKRLLPLDSPADVAAALEQQAGDIRKKIQALSLSLQQIEVLRAEVLQMQAVNFKKYADIIVNLQMKNDYYWLIKHFDDQTLDYIRGRFDKESGLAFLERFINLQEEALCLQKAGVPPESKQGQALAQAFWGMVMDFTGGDMAMLPKLMDIGRFAQADGEWKEKQAIVNRYIEPALDAYFTKLGTNPFEEGKK